MFWQGVGHVGTLLLLPGCMLELGRRLEQRLGSGGEPAGPQASLQANMLLCKNCSQLI